MPVTLIPRLDLRNRVPGYLPNWCRRWWDVHGSRLKPRRRATPGFQGSIRTSRARRWRDERAGRGCHGAWHDHQPVAESVRVVRPRLYGRDQHSIGRQRCGCRAAHNSRLQDTLEIRRGIRDDPWDHRTPYAPVLVPRSLRLPVTGRLDRFGVELTVTDAESLTQALATFAAANVESVAISLFNSYANAGHESFYADAIKAADERLWISASHHIAPLIGEYERTATTVLNAYIAPRTVGYLASLDARLRELGLPSQCC